MRVAHALPGRAGVFCSSQSADHGPALAVGQRRVRGIADELVAEQRDLFRPVLAGRWSAVLLGFRHGSLSLSSVRKRWPRQDQPALLQPLPPGVPGIRASACCSRSCHRPALKKNGPATASPADCHATVATQNRTSSTPAYAATAASARPAGAAAGAGQNPAASAPSRRGRVVNRSVPDQPFPRPPPRTQPAPAPRTGQPPASQIRLDRDSLMIYREHRRGLYASERHWRGASKLPRRPFALSGRRKPDAADGTKSRHHEKT